MLQRKDTESSGSSSHSHSRSNRSALRSKFQRYLWAGVSFAIYLVLAILFPDVGDDPSSNQGVFIFLGIGIITCILGALIAPYMPRLLGFKHQAEHRSGSRRSSSGIKR